MSSCPIISDGQFDPLVKEKLLIIFMKRYIFIFGG